MRWNVKSQSSKINFRVVFNAGQNEENTCEINHRNLFQYSVMHIINSKFENNTCTNVYMYDCTILHSFTLPLNLLSPPHPHPWGPRSVWRYRPVFNDLVPSKTKDLTLISSFFFTIPPNYYRCLMASAVSPFILVTTKTKDLTPNPPRFYYVTVFINLLQTYLYLVFYWTELYNSFEWHQKPFLYYLLFHSYATLSEKWQK